MAEYLPQKHPVNNTTTTATEQDTYGHYRAKYNLTKYLAFNEAKGQLT